MSERKVKGYNKKVRTNKGTKIVTVKSHTRTKTNKRKRRVKLNMK